LQLQRSYFAAEERRRLYEHGGDFALSISIGSESSPSSALLYGNGFIRSREMQSKLQEATAAVFLQRPDFVGNRATKNLS